MLLPAQSDAIDSLQMAIKAEENDSVRIEYLRKLGVLMSDYDVGQAIEFVDQAIIQAENGGYEDLRADALNSMGIIYYGIGDYEKTLEYFVKVQAYKEAKQDLQGMSRVYNNLGLLFKELGRYSKSIDYLEKSVTLKIESNDRATLSSSYNNLGLVYQEGLNDYKRAADCHFKALSIDRSNKDSYGVFISLKNIGFNHFKMNHLDSAQAYYNEAVMLFDETDDRYIKSEFLYDFALLNSALGQYDRAIEKHNLSIEMSERADIKLLLKKNYEALSQVFEKLGDFENALRYHKKFSEVNKSLFNADQNAKLADIETNFHIKTKESEIKLLKKEAEIKDLKISNNQMAFYWLIGILSLLLLIGVLQYRKNVFKTRTNKILEQKNSEIVDKNKNIMDSILYARNIQEAILPDYGHFKAIFNDAFVFTKPRDVVNGDFYWFAQDSDNVIIAAADCTGHGVPAAFLNVMGNSLLNQIVNEQNILEPSKILSELNARVCKNLQYDNLSRSDDGMDMGVCLFNRTSRKLTFAGAKRPLYYYRNGELKILKGDPYPVGGMLYDEKREYSQHEMIVNRKDAIYMFTDGIVDQFGGEDNKKFMYRRFRELLSDITAKPMEQQLDIIDTALRDWQGSNEQTDDILLIGVRL